MADYKADVSMSISEFDQLVTVKSNTPTYNDSGIGTDSWATTTTANLDIQPISVRERMRMEELGLKKAATHIGYGYYNISGIKISVSSGDKIVDASNVEYEILDVKEYSDSHLEIYLLRVTGKA